MTNTLIASLSLIAALALAPTACSAVEDGTIYLDGHLIDQTCTINGGAPNFTVNLPKVSISAMNTETSRNVVAGATNFSITLTNCKHNTSARVHFDAVNSIIIGGSSNLLNTGTARNISIQLLNAAGGVIRLGTWGDRHNSGDYVPIVNGQLTLNYAAQYFALRSNNDKVGPGTVRGAATYTIEYL